MMRPVRDPTIAIAQDKILETLRGFADGAFPTCRESDGKPKRDPGRAGVPMPFVPEPILHAAANCAGVGGEFAIAVTNLRASGLIEEVANPLPTSGTRTIIALRRGPETPEFAAEIGRIQSEVARTALIRQCDGTSWRVAGKWISVTWGDGQTYRVTIDGEPFTDAFFDRHNMRPNLCINNAGRDALARRPFVPALSVWPNATDATLADPDSCLGLLVGDLTRLRAACEAHGGPVAGDALLGQIVAPNTNDCEWQNILNKAAFHVREAGVDEQPILALKRPRVSSDDLSLAIETVEQALPRTRPTIPHEPFDPASPKWIKASDAADREVVTVESLRTYRSAGNAAAGGLSGTDLHGRHWAKQSKNSHVYYFAPSLRFARNRQ
ncbi:MAG: hypothetical protein U1D55_15470 [Phycisphaerae bacterium]